MSISTSKITRLARLAGLVALSALAFTAANSAIAESGKTSNSQVRPESTDQAPPAPQTFRSGFAPAKPGTTPNRKSGKDKDSDKPKEK